MRRPSWRAADARLVMVGLLLVLAWGAIGYRLFYVQGVHAADFAQLGIDQRVRHEELPAARGTIFDRDGVELAVTVTTKTLVADPSLIDDPGGVAKVLAPLLGMNRDDLAERLSGEGRFAYVARRLDIDDADRIDAFLTDARIDGFYFLDEPKRAYPAGALASQLIGFVRVDDNQGLEGLEFQYNEELSGTPGRLMVERDPYGRPIPQGQYEVDPAVPGADLVLTIDRDIQFRAQQALDEAMARTDAVAGTVIVVAADTGEILALANSPSFDPNDRSGVDTAAFRNRAVADTYEPGSTLKLVTVAAALEEGVVTPRTELTVPKQIEIYDKGGTLLKRYEDVGEHDPVLSVAEIVAKSSNVGTIEIQQLLGNDAHYRYLSAFGLGQRVSGDFPAEAAGLLEPVAKWCETTCGPSTAIGYRVSVTPLQMAAVYAAIANDGVWVQPHVVKEFIEGDGTRRAVEPIRRPVVSQLTAETMRLLLRGVVEDGTGSRASIPGFTVGGKTGTTEKYLPDEQAYSAEDRIASFIGMAPITDPQIVVAVVLDSPRGETEAGEDMRFGGVSAAPVFAEVAEAALHQLGVSPDAR